MTETDQIAAAILSFGHAREAHLDPEVATDGPFTILLTLYQTRENTGGVSMEAAVQAVDHRMSTSLYALQRLVDWGYVETVSASPDRRYRLTINAEQAVERYLSACLAMRTIVHRQFTAER